MKSSYALEGERQYYYWRDSNGHEIDLLTEQAGRIHAIEIKSSETMNTSLLKGLRLFEEIASEALVSQTLVYGGSERQTRRNISVVPWPDLGNMKFPWLS